MSSQPPNAVSSISAATDAAGAAKSCQLPEPNPVPITFGIVGAAESVAQLSEPHAVNVASAIPPATTHKLPPPPTSVPIPPSIARTPGSAEAASLSSQSANPGASATAPTHNPTNFSYNTRKIPDQSKGSALATTSATSESSGA